MADNAVFAPRFISDEEAASMRDEEATIYVDAFERQLRELYIIEHPKLAPDKEKALASAEFAAYADSKRQGCVYVFLHKRFVQR